ncbi:SGNH/GDSL hydrolase family protein [Curtobacterium flaccumfaciens]|uniref:SGNH/GDSL hydrolase family protein n=1 Tax=Curtobacterium flaccumfaciens TaxID=2035 RepID=UPI001AD9B248|nr:SGNH/GDSL hydrolase family protein [Curtobacterium flaccumfaciens]MBO9043452.1 SGNH/GDSL hydrolase family protein [Curtobacterium flaccumfaciens pv. flaccumfaciens]
MVNPPIAPVDPTTNLFPPAVMAALAKQFAVPAITTNRLTSTTLKTWSNAKVRAKMRTGRAEVAAIGTSITAGEGSSVPKGIGSWPARLQAQLIADGCADGGSGFIAATSNLTAATTDPRVSRSAGWKVVSPTVSTLITGDTAGASATFADTKRSTEITVVYMDWFSMTWTLTVDGGTPTSVTNTNTGALKKLTVTVPEGVHTAVITLGAGTSTSAYFHLLGVSFVMPHGVVVHNLGVGGNTASGALAGSNDRARQIAILLGVHLALIEFGANENPAGSGLTDFQNALAFGVRAFQSAGIATVLVTPPPSGNANRPVPQVVGFDYSISEAIPVPLVDVNKELSTWANVQAHGWDYATDSQYVHFNEYGHEEIAREIHVGLNL